jgi:uncharacterized protein YajQ (UPF0234 family)
MNYIEELNQIQKSVEVKKQKKVALEERKRMLEEDLGKSMAELKELGINSLEEADGYIKKTEGELNEGISKCRQILAGN